MYVCMYAAYLIDFKSTTLPGNLSYVFTFIAVVCIERQEEMRCRRRLIHRPIVMSDLKVMSIENNFVDNAWKPHNIELMYA